MLKVKVTKPGTMKKSEKGPYCVQTALAMFFDRNGEEEEVPRKIEFMCNAPMEPGEYVLSPKSFSVGQYDRLELRRLVFDPVLTVGGSAAPPRK